MADLRWLRFFDTHGNEHVFNVERVRRIEDLGEGRISVDGETVYADFAEVVEALGATRAFTSEADSRAAERRPKGSRAVTARP